MKRLFLSLFSIFIFANVFGQSYKVSGKLTDENSGEALIGATIISGEIGTITDFDGNYVLELNAGLNTLEYSYVGYESIETTIDLTKDLRLDKEMSLTMLSEIVVTADIAIERKTPIAFSNIPTLKLQEELASQDIPMILNSTPGAYATQAGGGDGDARITIRGFNQRNVAVMLDGVPVNDMENGWVYWSNWFGLDLVTQTIQVQRGLGASKLSIPSVGGTINILTKGIDAKKGLRLRQEFGNDGFLRTTLGATSGRLKNGWGVSAAASYKQRDGWVDGTFSKGYFYYLRVDKQIGDHVIGLQGFGAPQIHGQRPFTTEIAQVDNEFAEQLGIPRNFVDSVRYNNSGRKYNEHWGLRDGEVFNTRQNYYHKPQFSLRHSWQINPKSYLSNIAYLSVGNGGGTAGQGTLLRDSVGQIDFNKTIASNAPSVFNPEGYSNAYLRASINNHFWYGLLSTYKYEINEEFTFSGGIDGRYYKGDHYREVYDLLGGTGVRTDQGISGLGDRYDYDYSGFVRWGGGFALIEYSDETVSAFLNVSGARTGNKATKTIPAIYELDWVNLNSSTIKAGAAYNFNEHFNLFGNIGYLNKAQRFTNVINVNRFGDDMMVFNNFENEKIQALELGFRIKSKKITLNANAYYTDWLNKPLDFGILVPRDPSDPESERVAVNIPGIDALHKGIELEFSYEPTNKLAIEGIASFGDWTWNSASTGFIDLGNDISTVFEFDATGVHVGDAAQTQIGGLIRFEPIKKAYIKLKGTYFGRHYAQFQPEDLTGDGGGKESWKLPSYYLFDLHTGYTHDFEKYKLGARFNILNLTDVFYLSDARNNDNFHSASTPDKSTAGSATVHFGQGTQWNASVQLTF